MRTPAFLLGLTALAACGQSAPHEYPAAAKAQFEQSCPPASDVCRCTWDAIIASVPYEDYEAALERYRVQGLMDPRITRARGQCLERHDN